MAAQLRAQGRHCVAMGAMAGPIKPANQLGNHMQILIARVERSGLRQMAPQQARASLHEFTVDPLVFAPTRPGCRCWTAGNSSNGTGQ